MAIDTERILDHFVAIARQGVGSQLSTSGEVGNTYPSVIRSRVAGLITPDAPYVRVDILSIVETDGWQLCAGTLENGDYFSDTHYKLVLQYTVYGQNALGIAQSLAGYFRSPLVMESISQDIDSELEEVFGVESIPEMLATEYQDIASFNFIINTNDRLIIPAGDEGVGIIDTVILDGQLADRVDDPDPLPMPIFATSEN